MIHFNAEFWNNAQLCVLQVLNVKETNLVRKEAKKLAKADEFLCRNIMTTRR